MRPEDIIKLTPQPAAASVPGGERRETCSAHSPLPEKRALPFTSWVDHDMGACVDDCHGRLVAAFGYHPDGTPATDESELVVKACNSYPKLVEALKEARRYFSNRPDNWEAQMVDIVTSALREAGEL